MNIDSFYQKGFGHKVCQDYAIHGDKYVILSDGCSSAPNTEIGAKLLVESVRKFVMYEDTFDQKKAGMDYAMGNCLEICDMLSIPKNAMCCTLILSELDDEYIYSRVYGDGCVIEKMKTGEIVIHNYSFPSGAPFYYYYAYDGMTEEYFGQCGDKITETVYILSEGGSNIAFTETKKIEDRVQYVTSVRSDVEWVAICSDGIESFKRDVSTSTSKTKEDVNIESVVKTIFNFPAFHKGFLSNRMNWLYNKNKPDTFVTNKWNHFDDLSIGIIRCD